MNKASLALLLLLTLVLSLAIACQKISGNEYHIDASSCNGCGECVRSCPNDAIYFNVDGKAVIDQSKCTSCANCVAACPQNAVY
ncbi:MAG TPA: 4Fe-4S binding protein [Candidatus Syntrophosphaera sp.]|nr:4Fe-4S binding protein [Candidatus Syntrophosphaera sp.]